ncbi:hypothetical protein BKA63DRAFT_574701 [Paraphoma chrysanthemicola]|nr:hypothetical protein BKA63DRAFT_574701 [Paraphoma chrysanthemicola]
MTSKIIVTNQPPWVKPDGTIDIKLRQTFLKNLLMKTKGGFNAEQYRNTIHDIDRDIRKLTDMINGATRLESAGLEKKNRFQSAYWHSIRDQAQRLYDSFERTPQPAPSPPWDWRDIEIKSLQISPTEPAVAIAASQSSTTGGRNVNFAPSVTVTVTTQSNQPSSSSPNLIARIDSICRALTTACRLEYCLGILEDQDWQHHVYSVNGPASKARICESTSLHDIIRSKIPITPRQNSTLALTLASSILQFPVFLRAADGPPEMRWPTLWVSHSWSFTHGSSLLAFQEPEDLDNNGQADSMTECMIAERLARGLNNHESENYARAAFRCVTCNFDTFTFDFDDREFREAFYQLVVVPLQKDYDFVTSS